LGTGLRESELKLLEWRDVRLDDKRPCIQLRVEATQNKRAEVLPLSADLIQRLRKARPAAVLPTQRVLKSVPTLETWMTDLKRAKIMYKDAEKRIAGFHSLRVTFITTLNRAGLPPKVVMALARHTDPKADDGH
jgi:integrase